ncbi:MAG: hypothetical protein A2928_04725 [Candidatus Taylorbacteria bacterium RIFCSPLOWO2_01_FULL_45_15b]|uniref:VOC domain-containing protein n=1 Tax=Candidatus Taylorbacteria bacterium RIFCSPLOWO2_01_FULL_45_15b TaxID=1802319 RepID=A0A1G2NDN4_9BACT|nr:MAG: hypothetical protein A2928_04725 [Candidatus Taylorbacteria bacterium RIFCSPLOWO2_01_FULL_45_15b]
MKIKEIAFVCYGVGDIKKARKFYEDVLGLKPRSVWIDPKGKSGFIEYEIGPHTLAIGMGAKNFKPGKAGATVAVEVEDFEEAMKKIKKSRVKILMQPHESNVCWMMLVEDPSKNQIMIHKRKS